MFPSLLSLFPRSRFLYNIYSQNQNQNLLLLDAWPGEVMTLGPVGATGSADLGQISEGHGGGAAAGRLGLQEPRSRKPF